MKIKILYVDDEYMNLFLFERIFARKYDVVTATSGPEGLDALRKNPDVKVVISDMNMPDMNGIDFIKKAKELFPAVICYILTAYEITPEITGALQSGLIAQYFQKPFNMKMFDETISQYFGMR